MLYQDEIVALNKELQRLVRKYQGQTVEELCDRFQIETAAKNRLNLLTKRLIDDCGIAAIYSVCNEQDLIFKTVKLDSKGNLKESMSLPSFRYEDIYHECWENSSLRYYFYDNTFAFTVYGWKDGELYLQKIVIWSMPEKILEKGVRPVWEKMHECVIRGKIVDHIDGKGRYYTYFPSASSNPYVHVRPHAQNRADTYPLPVPDELTGLTAYPKHSFWINRSYVLQIISD